MRCVSVGRGFAVAVAALLVVGCTAPADPAVASAAQAFTAAVANDPASACESIAPASQKELLAETGDDQCAQALRSLELPGPGEVTSVEVAGQMARVSTTTQTLFLSRFDRGWLVVAAGCQSQTDPDLPHECLLKGS